MGRSNTELFEVGRGLALTQSAVTRFSREIPVGEPWIKLLMIFNHAVTIGTGTGPKTEGGHRIVRGITFRTDRGEVIADNAPGRALFRNDQIKARTAAPFDAIAASSSTFRAHIVLWLVDPLMKVNPFDTMLDTSRYNAVTLEILLGSISDLYGTVGTASVVSTLDLYIERLKGRLPPLPAWKAIRFHQAYGIRVPVDPGSITEIELEKASDLAYKRLHVFGEGVNTVAGIPFSGDADSNILDEVTLDDGLASNPFTRALGRVVRSRNKQQYSLEAEVTGLLTLDVTGEDGSLNSSLYAGDKSRLAVEWTNGTLPASDQVSLMYDGFRPLRP